MFFISLDQKRKFDKEEKIMKKRMISLVLVLVMMISAMVVPASAATRNNGVAAAAQRNKSYSVLEACLGALTAGTKYNQNTQAAPTVQNNLGSILQNIFAPSNTTNGSAESVVQNEIPWLSLFYGTAANTNNNYNYNSMFGMMSSMYNDVMASYRVMNDYMKYLYPVSDADLNRNNGSYTAAALEGLLGDLIGPLY